MNTYLTAQAVTTTRENAFDVVSLEPSPFLNPGRLSSYRVRADVKKVVALWDTKSPVAHRHGSKCATRTVGATPARSRAWMVKAFAAAQVEEAAGEKRTLDFCTRCTTELTSKPLPVAKVTRPAKKARLTKAQRAAVLESV